MGELKAPENIKKELEKETRIPFEREIGEMINESHNEIMDEVQGILNTFSQTFVAIRKEINQLQLSTNKKIEKLTSNTSQKKNTTLPSEIADQVHALENTLTSLSKIMLKGKYSPPYAVELAYFIFMLEVEIANSDIHTVFKILLREFGTHGSLTYLNAINQAMRSVNRPELQQAVTELINNFLDYKKGIYNPDDTDENEDEILKIEDHIIEDDEEDAEEPFGDDELYEFEELDEQLSEFDNNPVQKGNALQKEDKGDE